MALPYQYYTVNTADLVLDVHNPRFASSVLIDQKSQHITQEQVINHLLRYSDVLSLAKKIVQTKYLHGSEMISCYQDDQGNYIVAEGNRRVCACKLLLTPELIPDDFKKSFPTASDEILENIKTVVITLYPNRESIQSYLSDRHILGVRSWSTLEKNNFYMNLFQEFHDISTVKEFTNDSETKIKNCIIEYQFFMDVYNVLKKNGYDIEIEKTDYLPLADRFMGILVGDDPDVGLSLHLDPTTYRYLCLEDKKEVYEKILLSVGVAFLVRKSTDVPPRITGDDVSKKEKKKKLILDDQLIPGLLNLIRDYKNMAITDSNKENYSEIENESTTDRSEASSTEPAHDENEIYSPAISDRFIPKQHKQEYLAFFQEEADGFLWEDNEYDIKIKEIIRELAILKIYYNPVACACLYRCLLEACARRVFYKSFSSKGSYDESNLNNNLNRINNEVLFSSSKGSEEDKIRKSIKDCLNKFGLIDVLNLYIHYPKMVDTAKLSESWNTMKEFVIRCLSL